MKIIRDNKVYVNIQDIIYLKLLPEFVLNEFIHSNYNNDLIEFTNPLSIDFFKSREDILDYDLVVNLSNEELDKLINDLTKKLNNNTKIVKEIKYMLDSLIKYKNNKYKYDEDNKKYIKK